MEVGGVGAGMGGEGVVKPSRVPLGVLLATAMPHKSQPISTLPARRQAKHSQIAMHWQKLSILTMHARRCMGTGLCCGTAATSLSD